MEQNVKTRSKIWKWLIWIVVILGLMATAHILVNYFNIVEVLKVMHGGGWQH
jgi:hypothetical protein